MQVVEHHGREEVAGGTDRHHPRAGRRRQGRTQTKHEREMAEIVAGELHLPALVGSLEFGDRHHAGVVHQDVKRTPPPLGEGGDRRLVGQVETLDVYGVVAGLAPKVGCHRFPGLRSANGQGDLRARGTQRARRLDAQATRRARHHGSLAGQIDSRDHLVGRRLESKSGREQSHVVTLVLRRVDAPVVHNAVGRLVFLGPGRGVARQLSGERQLIEVAIRTLAQRIGLAGVCVEHDGSPHDELSALQVSCMIHCWLKSAMNTVFS